MKGLMGFIFVLLFWGCLPIPIPYGPYYKPSYEDTTAQMIREECHGYSGPSSGIRFTLDQGVSVTLTTAHRSRYPDTKHPLIITLTLPHGVTTQFLSDEITVKSDANTSIMIPKTLSVSFTASAESTSTFDLNALYPTSGVSLSPQKPSLNVWYWVKDKRYQGFTPTNLELTLPAVQFPKERIVFPPIHLTRQPSRFDSPYQTQQIHEEQHQKYALCQKETPKKRCQNILEVYQEGFALHQGEIAISGRVGGGDDIGVGVSDMVVTSTQPWKLNPPVLILKNQDTGEIQQRSIDKLYLHCDPYDVPFTSVVHAPSGDIKGSASIDLMSSLGERYSSHIEIQLPPILINGKKVVFKPIILDLQLLDGEFPPFNC